MKLQITKSKNSIVYYVATTKRFGNKTRTVNFEKIGTHNDLLKQGIEDPLAYAKQRVETINKEIKENIFTINQTIDLRNPLEINDVSSKSIAKNIGWMYIHKLLSEMDILTYLNNLPGREKFDKSKVIEYLIVNRFLQPSSKREAYFSKDKVFNSPEYSLNDGYRVLDKIDDTNTDFQKALFEGTKKVIDLDTSILYYDCTNFYFECETEDDNIYSEDGDIIQWGLRRYGASKEHRPNPIVQMGLFTDKNGIPIAYGLNHGSNNEQNTVRPLETRIFNDYHTSKFIYCSDGGLGSYDNRFLNTLNERNYVVTQSLKKTKQEELDLIMKDQNWFYVETDEKVSLSAFKKALDKQYDGLKLTEKEKQLLKYDMIYKKFPITRDIPAHFFKNIKIQGNIQMDELVYVTFSAKYYLYQKQLFDRQLSSAELRIKKDPSSIKTGPNDIRRFIKSIGVTDNGEVAKKKVFMIDSDLVEKEKMFHGFYAIATSLNSSIKDIIQINASRWKIEQSFRILKSDFDSRPVYVSTPSHIKAHFAICYVALLLYRILERKLFLLDPLNNSFTTNQILSTLRNMNVIEQLSDYCQSIYTGSNVLAALEQLFNIGLDKKYYKTKNLLKLLE